MKGNNLRRFLYRIAIASLKAVKQWKRGEIMPRKEGNVDTMKLFIQLGKTSYRELKLCVVMSGKIPILQTNIHPVE